MCEDEKAIRLYDSYRRLVETDQMGRKYKAMAVVSEKYQGPPWASSRTC